MKRLYTSIPTIWVTIYFALILQACAGSGFGSDGAGVQEYSQDFEKMKKVVERAIRSSNLNINNVNESGEDGEVIITVSRSRYVGNQKVQEEQGTVRIYKLGEGKTRIKVDNPDYHYSVPEHQKEDYQRIIFTKINRAFEKQNS